jgi:hypothetical protein
MVNNFVRRRRRDATARSEAISGFEKSFLKIALTA